jgi:diadenosine tetraphosphate (Ap4A) HIT family hydrolase
MSESSPTDCPFCRLPGERILVANAHALTIADAFPVSPGHTLILPRRHVGTVFELTAHEVLAIHELLCAIKKRLDEALKPGGYNIGVNVGTTAGQTVFHVHVHLIPRYPGDVANAVGGVRNIIPGRGRYPDEWEESLRSADVVRNIIPGRGRYPSTAPGDEDF